MRRSCKNAYQYYLQDDGVLQLRSDLTEDERTALEDAVTTPDIVLYMAAAQAANTPAGQNSMGMTGLAETPLPLRTRTLRPSPLRQRIWTPFAASLPHEPNARL